MLLAQSRLRFSPTVTATLLCIAAALAWLGCGTDDPSGDSGGDTPGAGAGAPSGTATTTASGSSTTATGGGSTSGGGAAGAGGAADTGGSAGSGAGLDCIPQTGKLADAGGARGIAIDDTSVYWTDSSAGTVHRASKCGGESTLLASSQKYPLSIAVDSTYVYWINSGASWGESAILRAPKSGIAPPKVLAADEYGPDAIVVDSEAVYWAGLSKIRRLALAGGSPVTVEGIVGTFGGIAIDESYIYGFGGDPDPGMVMVARAPKSGGSVEPLGQIPSSGSSTIPWCVAVDASNVYVTTYVGPLWKVPKAGGAAMEIGPSGYQRCVAVDSDRVYWATDAYGAGIFSVGKDGGTPTQLSPLGGVFLAVDDSHVYFTRDLSVQAVAKSPP